MAQVKNDSAKRQIVKVLNEQGYPTYARLLNLFDIYLTDNPETVGYMVPGKAKIVLNGDLDIEQISTIVRHELLHEWLNHGPRGEKFRKENPQLSPEFDPENVSNIAADYEISNVGYTEKDKSIARRIKLGDQVLQGLVTEDQYPDWQKMSYEDMYRELLKRSQQDRNEMEKLLDQLSKLSKKELEDLEDEMNKQSQNQSSSESEGKPKRGKSNGEPQSGEGQDRENVSQEYIDAYNDAIAKYSDLSEQELNDVLNKIGG